MPLYQCEVIQTDDGTSDAVKTYVIAAPSEELAKLLAFAIDGGLQDFNVSDDGRLVDYDDLVCLANHYTPVCVEKRIKHGSS